MSVPWNAPISDRFSSLCARVFSPAAAILESEKTLGTRLSPPWIRAWGRGALPINKMADLFSRLSWVSRWGYTQICVARGSVSLGSEDNDEAGELQLWYRERDNDYCLYASNTARGDMAVCKVIDVFTLHFQKCTDKIKTLLTKKSKFHFVQY